MLMMFLKLFAAETTQKRLYKKILYDLLNLIMIISLNKLNIDKTSVGNKFKVWWWWRIILTYFKSFCYFIHRVVIYNFSSICIFIWHQLLSHNVIHFKHLFFCINILFISQWYLVSLCYWFIWLRETLFQTWKTFLLIPKEIILYSIIIVSTEALFVAGVKYLISNYTHCNIDIDNTVH